MKKKIQLIPSGIPLVDSAWGGLYRGGTYILMGARKTGRTLLALQFAVECARQKEVCLYFTSMRPKDLMIQAASIDCDLQNLMNQNLIIVVRVAPPTDLYEVENPDAFLAEYLNDITTVVEQYQPNKIVFDEITPFIGFSDANLLRETFLHTTEEIEDAGITSIFILGEPATNAAKTLVDIITMNTTGIIYLKKNEESDENIPGGKITITPNIGHPQGKMTSQYFIEPYKGLVTELQPLEKKSIITKLEYSKNSVKDRKYKSLADIDLPEEHFTYSNFYNINDFSLILNNQIALFKSTGQVFTIISFKLDTELERKGLLTINQLQSSIRLAVDKKDKICLLNNKIIILITREETQKTINQLISKIKSNLPSTEGDYIRSVVPHISVYAVKVDENIQNANDLFDQLLVEEPQERNRLGYN